MNDSTPLPELPPEELASAYVDGELPAETRRIVEADPVVMAMVSAHAAVRDAVAGPVPELSDGERERLVAAGLAAIGPLAPQDGGQVVELAAARRARSRRLVQLAAGGLAALAAAGLFALVIARHDSASTNETSTQLDQTADSAAPPAETTAAAAGSGGSSEDDSGRSAASVAAAAAPATEAPAGSEAPAAPGPADVAPEGVVAGLVDLGPIANRTEFIATVRPFATAAVPTGPLTCATYPPPLATATFQGTPAYLVVIEAAAAGNRLALVDAATCAVLVKVDLAEQ